MNYSKVLLIGLIIAVTMCSCGNNENNKTNTNSTNYNPPVISGDKETVTYQVDDGKVETDLFMFGIPEDYSVDSTIDNFSVKNTLKGIVISVEENMDSDFNPDSYTEMLKQQFSAFGISVTEEDEIEISGVKARKITIKGLKSISENESMYCYLIPASDNHLIVSAALKQDSKENVEEAERIIDSIIIK